MNQEPRHQCIIYAGAPSQKLPAIAGTMCRMMADNYRCLYMNSPEMVESLSSSLAAMGVDVDSEISKTHLLLSSEPVSIDGNFDMDDMLQKLEDALDQALKDGYKGLWVSGDMTWELGSEKNHKKVMEYELKLEALFQKRKELHGICQYHYNSLPSEVVRCGLLMHGAVFINETLSYINPHFVKSKLPTEEMVANPLLDKMIAELCFSNSETNRKYSI